MTHPYRPSNSTEGELFMLRYCLRCSRDYPHQSSGCEILARTFVYDLDDPKYLTEWVADDGIGTGARCIAFERLLEEA